MPSKREATIAEHAEGRVEARVLLLTDDAALAAMVRRHAPPGAQLDENTPADACSDHVSRLWIDVDTHAASARRLSGPRVYFYSQPPAEPDRLPPGQFVRKPLSSAAAAVLWAEIESGRPTRSATSRARPGLTGRRAPRVRRPAVSRVAPAGECWLSEFHTLDLRDLCRSCVTALALRMGCSRASLYMFDSELALLTLADSTAEEAVAVSIPADKSAGHPAARAAQSLRLVRTEAATAIPLAADQGTCGVLWLEGSGESQGVDEDSLNFIGRCLAHARAYDRASREARLDCLTGLNNLRWMTDALRKEIRRAERDGAPVSILAVDLDELKVINDTHGHVVGDSVLRHVGGKVRSVLRDVDGAARVGGDEFVLLLPETDLQGALQVADRVRRIVRDDAPIVDGSSLPISVSIGAAQWMRGWPIDRLLHEADQAMYRAKSGARRG